MNTISRRGFFRRAADGVHGAALAYLFSRDLFSGTGVMGAAEVDHTDARRVYDLTPQLPHFQPRAKAVIQLFMNGGPSQLDLFDPTPYLQKNHGKPCLSEIAADVSSPQQAGGLLGSPFQFNQYGESGMWLSTAIPHMQEIVDDIAWIRSMYNSHPNHEPALYKIHSGRLLPGLPTIGSWVSYGLGTENQSLPAYVVMDDPLGLPVNGVQCWQSGYLPPVYQGTRFRAEGSPVLNLRPDREIVENVTAIKRDLLGKLDRIHKSKRPGQLQLDARISSYELAARMQLAASDALDLTQETQKTLDMYGVGKEPTNSYARRCLLARRLVERGVRFVQLFINGQIWDNHNQLQSGLTKACQRTDRPVVALVKDLKQRGLLDDTLVVWGGEFGRLPISQIAMNQNLSNAGRDHGPRGFSLWMAGGGIKGGTVYGATDDIGYAATENRVSVGDWHATMLHLLGLHHEELFYNRNGLHEKLTSTFDVKVVREVLA